VACSLWGCCCVFFVLIIIIITPLDHVAPLGWSGCGDLSHRHDVGSLPCCALSHSQAEEVKKKKKKKNDNKPCCVGQAYGQFDNLSKMRLSRKNHHRQRCLGGARAQAPFDWSRQNHTSGIHIKLPSVSVPPTHTGAPASRQPSLRG
jgi:hypothetical protein